MVSSDRHRPSALVCRARAVEPRVPALPVPPHHCAGPRAADPIRQRSVRRRRHPPPVPMSGGTPILTECQCLTTLRCRSVVRLERGAPAPRSRSTAADASIPAGRSARVDGRGPGRRERQHPGPDREPDVVGVVDRAAGADLGRGLLDREPSTEVWRSSTSFGSRDSDQRPGVRCSAMARSPCTFSSSATACAVPRTTTDR